MVYAVLLAVFLVVTIPCVLIFLQQYGAQLKNDRDKRLKEWRGEGMRRD